MVYVQSAAIEQLSYDEDAHTLMATFRESGQTYVYDAVPQDVYDGLIFADSIGAYFNAHVRDHFPCRKI